MSDDGDLRQRVGDAERRAAIEQLGAHWHAGRLDPTEHEARTTKAYAAVTRGDLAALFRDLPPLPATSPAGVQDGPVAPVPGEAMAPAPARPPAEGGPAATGSWLMDHREAIMGVTPFVAVACFFLFHSWVFFLLVPAAGAVLYAGDHDNGRKREAREARRARRRPDRGE